MLANIELMSNYDLVMKSNYCSTQVFTETALLDRFAGIIPGWKIPKFQRNGSFSVGLKWIFFGEALLSLRQDNRFMSYVQQHTNFNKVQQFAIKTPS